MKSLLVFVIMMLSMSVFGQDNIVSIVSSDPLSSADIRILSMLDLKYGDIKAVVLIEVNGKLLEQKFIVKTKPYKLNFQESIRYFFMTRDQKVIINLADTSAHLIVEHYDTNIPDDTAIKISMASYQANFKK